jgi:hypothetical protein
MAKAALETETSVETEGGAVVSDVAPKRRGRPKKEVDPNAPVKLKSVKTREQSPEHREAIASARHEATVIRDYMIALSEVKPKRGRKRTKETVQDQLQAIATKMNSANAYDRFLLIAERRELEKELASFDVEVVDLSVLEEAFVSVAKGYAERKGIPKAVCRLTC